MAITVIESLTGTAAAAPAVGNEFETTGPFTLYGDGFTGYLEQAVLHRLGPSGDYHPATNKDGVIRVKDFPNMVRVDTAGTFRVQRTSSIAEASVGYEES
jgi:hypothetical protein